MTMQAALDYAAAGIPIFPVARDKRPLLERGFHAATTDPRTIESWYRYHVDAGIGLPTGPGSGFWVLDLDLEKIDAKTGEVIPSGEVTLAGLVERYGPLPETLSQRTGGGGRQLLFKWTGERIRNRARDIGPGLDTRGVREDSSPAGYIVVPPSGHLSGGRYAWEGEFDLGRLAVAPPWLVYLATFGRREREAIAERCGITGS